MFSLAAAAVTALPAMQAYAQDAKKGDDVVTVAIIGEPPTLDPMLSTADVVSIVTQHFFETLYTFDSHWKVRPLLAKSMPKITDDGRTYTIPIREGVTFQDGSKMDAHDVVASLKLWEKVATRGQGVADTIESVTASDDNTVVIKLKKAYAPLLSLLAFSNSAAAIVPQEDIDGEKLTKLIGTGPYKLAEHKPDQYIKLTRFDGYTSRTEPADGTFGERKQIPAEIDFVPVPDGNTRIEGAVAGQYDYADGLSTEAYDRLEKSDKIKPVLLNNFGWPIFAFNLKAGLMTNLKMRQAVEAALAPNDMLLAAFGDKKFFGTDAALFPKKYVWHNEEGSDLYAQADPQKAAKLLKEAGYDGTPLRILTSHQYEFHYQMAQVAKAYLEQAGFKVKLDVVDWATLTERRDNPKLWDIYITHSPFLPEPALTSLYSASSRLGWDDPEKNKLLADFTSTTDQKKREELFAKLQKMVWQQVPFYKVGSFSALSAENPKMSGVPQTPWPFFWNAQFSQ
ncbi:ABC transporter substrate-binding protein [Pararhizobium mangrovi]|uniref:ABC transporter substrate-binding protein n=2 Tax=Pararhizobium mangrovi TaxID=2590452 RepID=A0A506UA45_9HYPH|nr:ABC transporter substrate-binding protein [Pararhizobium mangrovi]TPW30750.1 ABC transporter substrate-binding protein [Pararhizobium mangrovi]